MRLPSPAPSLTDLFATADLNEDLPLALRAGVGPVVDGRYLHWDSLRRRTPPDGLTHRQWWLGVKLGRQPLLRPLPLRAADGRPFMYSMPDPVLEQLHWLDQHAAGEIVVSETIRDIDDRRRYLVTSLFEEAIRSSQLEGAAATRQVAKDMLQSGRRPRDRGERMILNNFEAMSRLRVLAGSALTPDVVFDLHRVLTRDTLANPTAAGRLQRSDEVRVHVEARDGTMTHSPPPAHELPDRMKAMCAFANGESDTGFTHPVVRAILVHLWLGYDHPFEDGNGRTARALFYRQMLASKYWLFEYVSISRLLLKAPAQYGRAFLYTETDDFDATYFLLYQLTIIRRAIEDLMAFLRRKMAEVRETLQLLRGTDLNHRQVALLTHALRHAGAEYTFATHSITHRVTHQSARTDLLDLESRGLLERRVVGRKFYFRPVRDIETRLAAIP